VPYVDPGGRPIQEPATKAVVVQFRFPQGL
jgi:hypothetical protein